MKNKFVVTLIFCSLFIGLIFSQNENQNKINGLGFLKINSSSEEVIKEIEENLNCKNKVINTSKEYFDFFIINKQKPDKYIVELKLDTINYNSPAQASKCLKTRVFLIKGLIISNFAIEGLKLIFYDNILIDINCDYNKDLVDALKLKYGEGQGNFTQEKVTCIDKMNVNQIEYKKTSTETWENDDIITNVVIQMYYDDKCNKKFLDYISIYSLQKSKLNKFCEDEYKANLENRNKQEKLKNLKDL
jgi:hypothetical protein